MAQGERLGECKMCGRTYKLSYGFNPFALIFALIGFGPLVYSIIDLWRPKLCSRNCEIAYYEEKGKKPPTFLSNFLRRLIIFVVIIAGFVIFALATSK